MKNILFAFAAIFATSPTNLPVNIPQNSGFEQLAKQEVLGKEAISRIRSDYETGKYDEFLAESDLAYREALESGALSNLAATRGEGVSSSLIEKGALLQKKHHKEITALVEGDSSVFGQKVLSASAGFSSLEEERAVSKMASFRHLPPGAGGDEDENNLIALDLEYEFKAIHLDRPQEERSQDQRSKHIVLKMEKMEKMKALSQRFANKDLQTTIQIYGERFDDRLASQWDRADLFAYVRGNVSSANGFQEKVISTLKAQQEEFFNLQG